MCGESRTHGSEGAVRGRPLMATLQRRMGAFQMIDVCDKMLDAISRFVDVLIVVKVDFFFLEGVDQPFSVSVLPRASSLGDRNLNAMLRQH